MPDDGPRPFNYRLVQQSFPFQLICFLPGHRNVPYLETKIRPVNMVIAILLHCQGGKRKAQA